MVPQRVKHFGLVHCYAWIMICSHVCALWSLGWSTRIIMTDRFYYQFVNERGMICIYTQNENTWICNADTKCVITRLIHMYIYIYIHRAEITNKFTGMFHLQLGHDGYDLTTCLEWPWLLIALLIAPGPPFRKLDVRSGTPQLEKNKHKHVLGVRVLSNPGWICSRFCL